MTLGASLLLPYIGTGPQIGIGKVGFDYLDAQLSTSTLSIRQRILCSDAFRYLSEP